MTNPWEMDWSGVKIEPAKGGAGGATNVDKSALIEAQEQADAADRSLRLYDDVSGAIRRFKPGPTKGTIYETLMPSGEGGFWDGLGAMVGAIPRSIKGLMPQQDQDDFNRINAARAERIGIRAQEQAGVQAKNDEVQFKLADISPYKSIQANEDVVARARREALDQKLKAKVQAKWVTKYGSTANASPSGRTYEQAINIARRDFAAAQRRSRLPSPPPSVGKRRPAAGRQVYDINGNPL